MSDYLERFPPADQANLAGLITEFHFSLSNTQKFLMYLYEIGRRENSTVADILTKINLSEIVQNNNIQGKHKGDKVIERLFTFRFPETAALIAKGEYAL